MTIVRNPTTFLQPGQARGIVPASARGRRPVLAGLAGLALSPAILCVAGCSSPGSTLPPLPPAASEAYYLGPGDKVRIITFGGEELTGEFRVNDSGNIALPLLGTVKAAGLTPKQLEDRVTELLRKSGLYRNPSVSAEIVEYRPIFVLGEVSKPGQFPYEPGMTVLAAVALAGGFTYRAVNDSFSVVRSEGGHTIEARANRQAKLQPGDVLTVYERHF